MGGEKGAPSQNKQTLYHPLFALPCDAASQMPPSPRTGWGGSPGDRAQLHTFGRRAAGPTRAARPIPGCAPPPSACTFFCSLDKLYASCPWSLWSPRRGRTFTPQRRWRAHRTPRPPPGSSPTTPRARGPFLPHPASQTRAPPWPYRPGITQASLAHHCPASKLLTCCSKAASPLLGRRCTHSLTVLHIWQWARMPPVAANTPVPGGIPAFSISSCYCCCYC